MALGLSKMVKTYNFVATVHMMCDILPHLSRLSKVFQRQDINLAHVEPMVRSTIAALEKMIAEPGIQLKKVNDVIRIDLSTHQISARVNERESFDKNIRLKFLPNIISHIQQRFPDNRIISALSALDPTNMPESDFIFYGEEEMQTLADHFQLDSDTILSEWIQFRELVCTTYNALSFEKLAEEVLSSPNLSDAFPNMAKFIACAMVLPVSTADCERAFSAMSRTKTDLRNRLSTRTLDHLMRISIEGPVAADFDFLRAANKWLGMGKRRIAAQFHSTSHKRSV